MDVSLQIKDMLGSWGQSSQPDINNKGTTPRTPNTEYKNEAQNALTKILLESSQINQAGSPNKACIFFMKIKNMKDFLVINDEYGSPYSDGGVSQEFMSDQDAYDIQRCHAKIWK